MSATPHLYLSIREELESGLFSSRTESRSWVWSHWRRVGCTMLHGSQGLRRPTTHVPTVTQCQTIFMAVVSLSNSYSSPSSSNWSPQNCTSPWLNYVVAFLYFSWTWVQTVLCYISAPGGCHVFSKFTCFCTAAVPTYLNFNLICTASYFMTTAGESLNLLHFS